MQQNTQEPELMDEQQLDLRSPQTPTTLDQLVSLEAGRAEEIARARVKVLQTLRQASIQLTSPEDWLLFRRVDGRVTAYLQDCGAERIAPLWGISIMNVDTPEKIPMESGGFVYVIRGDGYCNLTRKSVVAIEGFRASTDDFVKDKTGAQLEFSVRKAARANLDGSVVRDLAGMSNVPAEELELVWKGSNKKLEHCAQGRGYGTQAERHGDLNKGEYGPPPACPTCKKTMRLIAGKDGREPFFGCVDFRTCGQKPITAKKVSQNGPQSTQDAPGREPGDDTGSEHGNDKPEKLGEKKNRLGDLLKASKLPDARKQELRAAIIGAKSVEELTDVEAAIGEA